MEKSATSCPWARNSSISSNRYTSVPLNGKLYLLQNKIRISSVLVSRADSPEEVARIIEARRELQMQGATLVTVPVPENEELPLTELQHVLDESLAEAEKRKITGRDLTPFLLSRMAHGSGGATLKANIALLENNARVAAEIARAL